jgi:hypothetical protein
MTIFLIQIIKKIRRNRTTPKGREGFDQLSAIAQISRQNSLEFIIESVLFIKADNHLVVYGCLFYGKG